LFTCRRVRHDSRTRAQDATHLDQPLHRHLLGARIRALHGIVHQRLHLGLAQLEEVGEDLRRGMAVALARIAEAVDEDGEERIRLRGHDGRLLLQLQALEEVAQGGEAGRDQGGRGGGGDGEPDALEDGSLAALGDAIVLDAGLEVVEQRQARVDVGRRLLQRGEKGIGLLLHGDDVLLRGRGGRGAHEDVCLCIDVDV